MAKRVWYSFENQYAQTTDNAANKVEAKYGATAGQAIRDLSQAARSGDLTGFASNQAAAGMQRFDDTKARYTDKAQTQIDNTLGRGADKLKKATSKLPSGLANAINGKIDSLSGGLSGALGQKAGDFIGSIGISEEEIASAAETPKALAFAVNLVNKLVINSGNVFSIKDIVDKLLEIEASNGYDAAHLASKQFNYSEICKMAHIGDPKNDPNIMPSRFMLIPGADDETLQAKGNLNEAPWSVAQNTGTPELISIANLRRNLAFEGFLNNGSTASPQTPSADPIVTNISTARVRSERDEHSYFDDLLKANLFDYLRVEQANIPSAPRRIEERVYVIEPGEDLGKIAKKFHYPNWQVIHEANRSTIPNPNRVRAGQRIILPPLVTTDLTQWREEREAPAAISTGQRFEYPIAATTSTPKFNADKFVTLYTPKHREEFGGLDNRGNKVIVPALKQVCKDNLRKLVQDIATYFEANPHECWIPYMAYMLATVRIEAYDYIAAKYFHPVTERIGETKAEENYGSGPTANNPERARRMGNTDAGDGYKYRGRGFVQLTWKNNYKARDTDFFGGSLDLVNYPDKANEWDNAMTIMIKGMLKGSFTGKKLADYISLSDKNYRSARRVINGTDKADYIASHAVIFEQLIEDSEE